MSKDAQPATAHAMQLGRAYHHCLANPSQELAEQLEREKREPEKQS